VRNLRAYYDVLRIQAGLPVRAPVCPALAFLHRPKKAKPKASTPIRPKRPSPRGDVAAPRDVQRTDAARGAPDTDEAVATALLQKIEQQYRDGSLVRRSFKLEDTDMETSDTELVRWWNEADELTRAFWMGWSHSLSPAKAFAAFRETTARAAKTKARMAKAAALSAARRSGANGTPAQH